MIHKTEDLYGYFGFARNQAAGGRLSCWVSQTPVEVSALRQRPAILILPGGAYRHTSPREAEPVALRFAARGYAAFVLHYSCAPSCFPTALREAAMAVRYIRSNAEAFAVDPRKVAALGFSAGGHLCGTLGTLYDSPEVADVGDPQQLRPDALGVLIVGYTIVFHTNAELSEPVEKIRNSIRKNYSRPDYALDEVIREMPFHYDYLRKLFKKEVGSSPLEYMTMLRMKNAKTLLTTQWANEYTISEIAHLCGFEDALYFSRVFKKYYGCSPTNFTKKRSATYQQDPGRIELTDSLTGLPKGSDSLPKAQTKTGDS